jgi:hypothetical protein
MYFALMHSSVPAMSKCMERIGVKLLSEMSHALDRFLINFFLIKG